MRNGFADPTTPPHAMQLRSIVRLEGIKDNGK